MTIFPQEQLICPPNPQPPTPPPVFDDWEITDVQPRIWADVLDMSKNVIYEKMFQKDPRFKIYIEKVLIAEVQDFVKAVTILIAAQYVFNVAYSKKLLFYTELPTGNTEQFKLSDKSFEFNVKIEEKQFKSNMEQCFVLVYFEQIFC